MPMGICPACKEEMACDALGAGCLIPPHNLPGKIGENCSGSLSVVAASSPDLDKKFSSQWDGSYGQRYTGMDMQIKIDDKTVSLHVQFAKPMSLAEFGGSLPVMSLRVEGPPFKVYTLEGGIDGEKQS